MEGYDSIKEDHRRKLENSSFQRDTVDLSRKENLLAQVFVCIGIFVMIFLINFALEDGESKIFNDISKMIESDKTNELQTFVLNFIESKSPDDEIQLEDYSKDQDLDKDQDQDVEDNFSTDFQIDEELLNSLNGKWKFTPPVKSGIITSLFGIRNHPITNENKVHEGIDISNEKGTKIYSVSNGTVKDSDYSNSYGNYTIVSFEDFEFLYAHMDKSYVSTGEKINQGEKIGLMGSTGQVTGVHLHFEVKKDGKYMDPFFIVRNFEIQKIE